MTSTAAFKSPLHQMTQTTATCLWNDSACEAELQYALEHGAVGATCNPVIAVDVVKQEWQFWKIAFRSCGTSTRPPAEGELAWRVIEDMSVLRAALLAPIFEAHGGRNGRLSVQTDPRVFRDGAAILDQAIHFDALAPNMIVKIPATTPASGRSRRRRRAASASTPRCRSACRRRSRSPRRSSAASIVDERDGHDIVDHGTGLHDHGRPPRRLAQSGRRQMPDHASIPAISSGQVSRRSSAPTRSTRSVDTAPRLLVRRVPQPHALERVHRRRRGDLAAARLAGALQQQRRPGPCSRCTNQLIARIVDRAHRLFADFRRAYEPDGLSPAEFDDFGPTRRTIRQFSAACHDLERLVRDVVVADPESTLKPVCRST